MSKFKDWAAGASTSCFGMLTPDLAGEYTAAGLKTMELSTDYRGYYDILDFINKSREWGKAVRQKGVWLRSIHLPFGYKLDISSDNREDREFTVKTNLELIEAAAKAELAVAVVHPSSEPIEADARKQRMERSIENLDILAHRCTQVGIKLAVENLPRTCLGHHSDEIKYMLDAVTGLFVTYDTNHLLIQDNLEFIRTVGKRIATLHVSDYDFIDERHIMPLEGKNDWIGIIKALEEAGYDGAWNYEVRKNYTPRQLAENKAKLEMML